jgi:PIN domain nuclease of toxin-antitoxin system
MLDTYGLIRLVNEGGRVSRDTLETIKRADLVYVSAVSALEIGCNGLTEKTRFAYGTMPLVY